MNIKGQPYRTIWEKEGEPGVVCIIDQRYLPHELVIEELRSVDDFARAIREMHVRGAPLVKRYGLEPIATGYMLIESGPLTSVQYMSSSLPIPRSKNDIACAHALAAQYLGMKMVYLEAGSGAAQPVPVEMVHEVSTAVNIPVIVGGGLRAPDQCAERIAAGAAFVVMGNCFESEPGFRLLREAAAATHPMESIRV